MRTTVRLDDDLMRDAKRHALETGRSLTQLLRDSLVALMERERGAASPRTLLPTYGGSGFVEGVNPSDWKRIRDHMDGLV